MGFLEFKSVSTYSYPESKCYQRNSKKLAVQQFINLYKNYAQLETIQTQHNRYAKYGFELEVQTLTKEDRDG